MSLNCRWYQELFNDNCQFKRTIKIRLFYYAFFFIYLFTVLIAISQFPTSTHVLDVDRSEWGTTFMTDTPFNEVAKHVRMPVDWLSEENCVREIAANGEILWEQQDMGFAHEIVILPNKHLLVVRTGFDDIVEIDYPNHNIVWQWQVAAMNWTKVNPAWGADHYFNNPTDIDWSHVNDADIKSHGTWDSLLISIRNFDMVFELNLTAEKLDPYNPANIIWSYGEFGNYTLLRHQHNPEYLPNGNIMVADSRNSRIVEINYTTKQQVWEYSEGLQWCRDADPMSDGNILITDSDEILIINKTTKQVLWRYNENMISPYESDELPNGHILIAAGFGGFWLEIDPTTNIIIDQYGQPFLLYVYVGALYIALCANIISYLIGNRKLFDKCFLGGAIGLIIVIGCYYAQITSAIMYLIVSSGAA